MTRRSARELIMQMLYEGTFHSETERARILSEHLQAIDDKEKTKNKPIIEFVKEEYEGVVEHLDEIDKKIEGATTNWSINRIAKVDLSILRLAIYELCYTDIPNKVTVNETLEIAKTFSTEKSPKYINGVLGNIIKELEA